MDMKDLEVRLEVVKLLATIGDKEGIAHQIKILREYDDPQLSEIIALLEGNNIRQALYLIKNYKLEHFSEESLLNISDDQEVVLGVEDMLRMSPLAQETLSQYRAQAYTKEDLDRFSQNIVANSETKKVEVESKESEVVNGDESEKRAKSNDDKESDLETLVESVDKNIPLDEISATVMQTDTKKKRSKVLSKYKMLRKKFAKKEKEVTNEKSDTKSDTKENKKQQLKISQVAKNLLNQSQKKKEESSEVGKDQKVSDGSIQQKELSQLQESSDIKKGDEKSALNQNDNRVKKEEKSASKSVSQTNKSSIYPPIPHIEEKYRRYFIQYPPLKESDVWVEEVIKFLKMIAKESYTDKDVENFLEEFDYFVKRGDIVRASQVILLAGATDSKYAQFRLARELFSGRVLQRNLEASYAIIRKLAKEHYPEAVCDLAQFYEYGILEKKNKKIALQLYEKAFELGSVRASKHINRLKESSGGFLASLLKLH